MAIVKITFIKHAKNVVNYVMKDRSPNDLVDGEGCTPETAAEQFAEVAKLARGKGDIRAIHIVQSWNESESRLLKPEVFQSMGRKLVEGKFPGHDFVIATHTETGKTHNHIIVNPWHRETGKKIPYKKKHLYQLRDLNDKICKEHGLSVIDNKGKERQARLPDKARAIAKYNGTSYLLDIMQKADFARAYSVNYDQYVAILGEFNIQAVVQNKNVTYFYPGQKKGKRGAKLGKLYSNDGLDEAFKTNKETFAKHPGLRTQIRQSVDALKQNKSAADIGRALESSTNSHFKIGYRDLNSLQKDFKKSERYVHPSVRELQSSFFPLEELNRARRSSIFEYCKKNKIELEKHSETLWKLKGRPYVHLSEFEWTNTKNRTKGSLIDFVAAHKGVSFASAVAIINNNSSLNLIEKKLGEVKRPFTSFYIPKQETMELSKGARRLGNLLRFHGVSEKHSEGLLKNNLAQVGNSGIIRLFAPNNDKGAIEFETNSYGRWVSKKQGDLSSPFAVQKGSGPKVRLFTDPFTALRDKSFDPFRSSPTSHSTFVMMEPNKHAFDLFLAENPHLNHIEIITAKDHKRSSGEIDLFETLRRSHSNRNISWGSPTRGLDGPEHSGFDL